VAERPPLGPDERAARRDAVGELTAAADTARELAARLRADPRDLHDIASVDDPEVGERWYSQPRPRTGLGSTPDRGQFARGPGVFAGSPAGSR
jgi:hypothetical protein